MSWHDFKAWKVLFHISKIVSKMDLRFYLAQDTDFIVNLGCRPATLVQAAFWMVFLNRFGHLASFHGIGIQPQIY